MNHFTVIAGSSSTDLASKIAKKLKARLVKTTVKVFPDGEVKISLNSKLGKGPIIVVQSSYPPVDTNLLIALSLISKARDFSRKVIAIIPYLGYARQDREFLKGEIITLKVIAKLLKSAGVSQLFVVDIHSKLGLNLFKFHVCNISAIPELVKYFQKLNLKKPLVVSPDLGGKKRAQEFAKLYGTDYIALEKHRDRKTGKVEIQSRNFSKIKDRDLVLVDDMISTGGSIIKATQVLKKFNCGKIFVTCTHGLFRNNALSKIKKAGVKQIISTNTIPNSTSVVDVSRIISKKLEK